MPQESLKPKTKTPEQAFNSLLALCAKAEKSSGDALRLMYRWGVDPAAREQILARLIEHKFIDDNRYAEAFVREKLNLSGWGEYKLRSALKAKGIAQNIIDELLSELDSDKMRERLKAKLIKKSRMQTASSDLYKVKSKLVRYGLSLGYPYDMVLSVSDELSENL